MKNALFIPDRKPEAPLRLVVFPHASGSPHFFMPWMNMNSPLVETIYVEYSGHGRRMAEPLKTSIEAVVEELVPLLNSDHGAKKTVLFGHSLGSLIAFEVAQKLEGSIQLMVSACKPPHLCGQGDQTPIDFSDEGLIKRMRDLGGTSAEVFADPELIQIVLYSYRSDLQILQKYRLKISSPLNIPIHVLGGADDPTASVNQLMEWQQMSSLPIEMTTFNGGHFYLIEQKSTVAGIVAAKCRKHLYGELVPSFEALKGP